MFSTPTRGSPSRRTPQPKLHEPTPDISPVLATEIATEYASLKALGNCPRGMYLTPSPESILRWHGVLFVHRGPYAGYVLRFSLLFPVSYPRHGPTVTFDSDIFHPMIDPKSKVWCARGRLAQWQPGTDHVPHLLHSVKASFRSSSLASVTEEEAVNKQVWSLYQFSHKTFLSLTAQRALHSTSKTVLYPPLSPPATTNAGGRYDSPPSTPTRTRKISNESFLSHYQDPAGDPGPIVFKQLSETEGEKVWEGLKDSLEGRRS